ncbi:LysR family transcriptional regulator [Pseudohalocynthiibacter aestuariivivens]|uniref:LysR family transcriptional regulator n=1 Tax=Pseudohalocynthiibacter aestuariivivens TaxID=1591409 RepID=A0ABV5J9P2_9RHOB|nr:LysR family transcriptional regulator [Pseudohalocynthiibacter aestuariivivens]MBS9718925.1 LysR family transcriptional regulator [Pseudohalocynthiibacter aestuariivivens]
MNLRHLKYFVATAETGQVSRAANALSISQSSVTSAIKELEISLGAELFHRSSHGMELTDSGREFLAASKEILEKVDEACRLTRRRSETSGVISIAATYTVLGYFLPYHLDRLSQLHPGLEIQLHELNRESIEDGLLANRYDMAVVLTSNLNNPEIETETLLKSSRRLWVPNGHRFSRVGKASFEEISKENYIMLTVDEAAHTAMKYWSLTNFRPKTKLRTSSVEAVRSMVANGQGVTILSDMVYRPWSLEGKRLETVSTDIEIPTMDVGLAWRKASDFSSPMNLLHNYFKRSFLSPQFTQYTART